MENVEYKGDITHMTPRQLEYIAEILSKRGFNEETTVTIEQVGEAGDTTSAVVKRFIAEKNGDKFKMIAKLAPDDENSRTLNNTLGFFHNEHVMYSEVLPKFVELEKAARVPEAERVRHAECYGSIMEPCNEVILLEDLHESNFKTHSKFKMLSDEEVREVLKTFSRFHTLSYALRDKEPDIFEYFKNKLVNPREGFDSYTTYFQDVEKDTIALFKDDKYRDAIKGTIGNLKQLMVELSQRDKESSYTVIEQGDAWTNNIMFQRKDGEPPVVCMIDYQLSRANRPVSDLLYMIFNCTDYETRNRHYRDWIDHYHAELGKSLARFGLKVHTVYPRKQLDEDMTRYSKLYLALGILVATSLAREPTDLAELKSAVGNQEIEEVLETARVLSMGEPARTLYKTRVKGLIDSYYDFGLLEN